MRRRLATALLAFLAPVHASIRKDHSAYATILRQRLLQNYSHLAPAVSDREVSSDGTAQNASSLAGTE
eukprot:6110280-Prymnesium_polylepis.1